MTELGSTEHDHLLGAGSLADFENSGDEFSSDEGEGPENEGEAHADEGEGHENEGEAHADETYADNQGIVHRPGPQRGSPSPAFPDSQPQPTEPRTLPESQTQPDSQEASFAHLRYTKEHSVGPKTKRKNRNL